LSAIAKEVFKQSSADEQASHSHLMLLGAHPTEDIGIPGYARTSVHILRSPDFVPECRLGEVVSIGSGSSSYQQVLNDLSSDVLLLMKGEIMGAGMGFSPLSFTIQKTVEKNPTPGISQHTHICIVRRGTIQLFTNDQTRYPASGEKIEFKMPPVATSWEEFTQIVFAASKPPHCAIC
jgi:hypothetical protein